MKKIVYIVVFSLTSIFLTSCTADELSDSASTPEASETGGQYGVPPPPPPTLP